MKRQSNTTEQKKAQVQGDSTNPTVERTRIVQLKSDLVLMQSEIDARTGSGGMLMLQHLLQGLNWTVDPVVNLQTCVLLYNQLLDKVGELVRASGSPSSTAPMGSKVGDLIAYFHGRSDKAVLPPSASPTVPVQLSMSLLANSNNVEILAGAPQASNGPVVTFKDELQPAKEEQRAASPLHVDRSCQQSPSPMGSNDASEGISPRC